MTVNHNADETLDNNGIIQNEEINILYEKIKNYEQKISSLEKELTFRADVAASFANKLYEIQATPAVRITRAYTTFKDYLLDKIQNKKIFKNKKEFDTIIGNIDLPLINSKVDGYILVSGWAASRTSNIKNVEVLLGNKWLGTANINIDRPDVKSVIKNLAFDPCGFSTEFFFYPDEIGPGIQELVVKVTDHRNNQRTFRKPVNNIVNKPVFKTGEEYRKRWDEMTLSQWLIYHHKDVLFYKSYWMGSRALKNPFDAWIYQEIIYEVKPDFIIEIGSNEGGSTLYLSNILDLMQTDGKVISIDIDRSRYTAEHQRIITITGDSSSREVLNQVEALVRGKKTLVIHDGNHSKIQVLRDLKSYADFVSLNSYLIVEDGIMDLFNQNEGIGMSGGWPFAATLEFLETDKRFSPDLERERYILTYNPCGFLKRLK